MMLAIQDSGQMLSLQLLLTLQHWNIRYENKDKWSLTVCYKQSSTRQRFAHYGIACQLFHPSSLLNLMLMFLSTLYGDISLLLSLFLITGVGWHVKSHCR